MLFQVIMAGFGGQGIMYIGDLFAQACLDEGRHAAFMPSYGAAVRGGTANCVVTLSDTEIGSPLMDCPDAAIVMNTPSFLQFRSSVKKGGVIIANASMIDRELPGGGGDARVVWVPATEISREVTGDAKSANMAALGAFLGAEPVVGAASIEGLVTGGGGNRDAAAQNLAVFRAGLAQAFV